MKDPNAVSLALYMALTAPTDEQAAKAAAQAESLARGMSSDQVEQCKAVALALVENDNA